MSWRRRLLVLVALIIHATVHEQVPAGAPGLSEIAVKLLHVFTYMLVVGLLDFAYRCPRP